MKLKVTTRGVPAVTNRMRSLPDRLRAAMYDATEAGIKVTADMVYDNTPVMVENRGGSNRYPGELRDSIQSKVTINEAGALSGVVWTETRWAPFVEHGTAQHGRARHMFQLGQRTARPLVAMIFESAIGTAIEGA